MALSELHLALIGAGVTGVLMVWAYNVWQDRKYRKTAERIFSGGKEEVPSAAGADSPSPTFSAGRQEPTLATDTEAMTGETDGQALTEQGSPPGESALQQAAEDSPRPGDPVADCTLVFRADEPVAAPVVMSIQRSWALDPGRRLSWRARESVGMEWQLVSPEATSAYREWAVSLPLADRRGAVSEAEISAFTEASRALARQVGATLAPEIDVAETAAHAAALDQFCASVDIQFALHVVDAGGGTFAGTKLRGVVEAAGMALEDDGVFRLRDAAGGEEFSLGNISQESFDAEGLRSQALHGVSLSIDVPRVTAGPEAFEHMLATARQVATALGGVLVDAQRAPLAEPMIAAIRDKIAELQQRMRDGGIDPGSSRALRLFA